MIIAEGQEVGRINPNKGSTMAKRVQMVVNSEVFQTKKELTERCRKILYSYSEGQFLNQDHTNFLVSLVSNYHSEGDQKVGCGVQRMWVQKNEGTMGFWLERTDGSKTDFSFVSCINKPSMEKDVKRAFRQAIFLDKQQFKRRRLTEIDRCEFSGELLSGQEVHVDHMPPNTFENIVKSFMDENKFCWNDIPVNPTDDGITGTWVSDVALREKFRTYHNERAELRLVTGKVNLSDIRRSQ